MIDELHGIERPPAPVADLEVQVRAGGGAGVADPGDLRPRPDRDARTGRPVDPAEVGVERDQPRRVADLDEAAIAAVDAGAGDHAIGHRMHGQAFRGGDVDAFVHPPVLFPGQLAQAERRDDLVAVDRPAEAVGAQDGGRRRRFRRGNGLLGGSCRGRRERLALERRQRGVRHWDRQQRHGCAGQGDPIRRTVLRGQAFSNQTGILHSEGERRVGRAEVPRTSAHSMGFNTSAHVNRLLGQIWASDNIVRVSF